MPLSRVSTSGRVRVPANSLPRGRRRSKRASRSVCGRSGSFAAAPGAVTGSTNVGSTSSSLARSTRCRALRGGYPAEGDVFLFRDAPVALLPRRRPDDEDREQLLFVDGATRLTGPNPVSHPPHEPPFDRQRKGSGGGGRTRGRRGRVHVELFGGDAQVVPRTPRNIPNPSCA